MYIESYTRIKPQIFRHNLKQHKENESYVQVTYFSEYSDSYNLFKNAQFTHCAGYKYQ